MSPSDLRIRQLISPSAEQLERAAAALDKAFSGDHFTEYLLEGVDGAKKFGARFQLANVGACPVGGGELWVAEVPGAESEEAEIVGVAGWYGPGEALFVREEGRAAGWDQLVADFSRELRDW